MRTWDGYVKGVRRWPSEGRLHCEEKRPSRRQPRTLGCGEILHYSPWLLNKAKVIFSLVNVKIIIGILTLTIVDRVSSLLINLLNSQHLKPNIVIASAFNILNSYYIFCCLVMFYLETNAQHVLFLLILVPFLVFKLVRFYKCMLLFKSIGKVNKFCEEKWICMSCYIDSYQNQDGRPIYLNAICWNVHVCVLTNNWKIIYNWEVFRKK